MVARWWGWVRLEKRKLWGCDETCCLINLTYEPSSTEQLCAAAERKKVFHRCLSMHQYVCERQSDYSLTHAVSAASSTNNYNDFIIIQNSLWLINKVDPEPTPLISDQWVESVPLWSTLFSPQCGSFWCLPNVTVATWKDTISSPDLVDICLFLFFSFLLIILPILCRVNL